MVFVVDNYYGTKSFMANVPRGALKFALDIIYPPKCIVCEEILPMPIDLGIFFCSDSCANALVLIDGITCTICGAPAEQDKEPCRECKNRENIFTKNIATFVYEDMVLDIIQKFKYAKKTYVARGLSLLMFKRLQNLDFGQVDYIVPIPIHKNRLKKRGFNQAALLAKNIADYSKRPVASQLLRRIKDTKPLSNFSPTGRQNTLKGAFAINKKYNVADKTILLVDDIFTTGATFNECSQVLYENGAKEVICTTLSVVEFKAY